MSNISTLVVCGRRALVCSLLVGFANSLAIAEVQLHFVTQTPSVAGNRPVSVAIGDFDGDDRQDLAVANVASDNVSVLLGNGDGSFGTPTHYPAGYFPNSVAIGDFNGDGRQDLATANAGDPWNGLPGDLSVLLGNGDGSFATQTRYPAGNNAASIAIGDFDGDGRQDIAVANWGDPFYGLPGDLSVLLGNGDGSFAAQVRYPAGLGPLSVAIGDFDGDARQDIAVANEGDPLNGLLGDLSVLLGNGDGSFATQTRYVAGYRPARVAIGDFDGDGRQDIAAADWDSADVSVLLGNGDGSFAAQVRYPAGGVYSLAIGDFDGDGQQDLAVAHSRSENISVLLGDGDGSFGTPTGYMAGDGSVSIAVGEFDGDGRQDLAVANGGYRGSDDVSVLLNRSYLPVEIDNRSRSINPYGRGVAPVAIFGSEEFDVTGIDVTTLRFGPGDAALAHDLTDPFHFNDHLEDMNLDGYMDLMTHYRVQETGIGCGEIEAMVSGQTLSGLFFEGTDTFETVGCTSSRPSNRLGVHRLEADRDSQPTDRPVKPRKVD